MGVVLLLLTRCRTLCSRSPPIIRGMERRQDDWMIVIHEYT